MASAATARRRPPPPPGLHDALVEVLRRGVGRPEGRLLARLLGISTATARDAMGEGGLQAVAVMEKRSLLTRSVHRLVAALRADEAFKELLNHVLDALDRHKAMAWAEPPPKEDAVAAGRSAAPPRALAEEKQQQPTLVELWQHAPPKAEGLEVEENKKRGRTAAKVLTPILSGPKAGLIGLELNMSDAAWAKMDRGEYEAAKALLDGGFLTEPAKIDRFLAAVWEVGLQGQEYSVAAMFAPAAAREARNAVASTVEALRERVIFEEAYDAGREGDQFSVWQLYALVHATPSVCRIKTPSRLNGTGFVVAEGVVLTARHVLKEHLGAAWQAAEGGREFLVLSEPVRLQFNVSEDEAVAKIAGVPKGVQGVLLPAGTRVVAGEALDYCFLLVGGIQQFQDLAEPFRKPLPLASKEMQRRAVEDHLPLAVVHHPDGKPMHISLQTGKGPAGDDATKLLLHHAPTQPGSSGAPVLAMDDGGVRVVSLHRASAMASDDAYIDAKGAAVGPWHNLSLLLDAIGPPPSAAPRLADAWREAFENDREVMGTAYAVARPLLDAAAGVEELDAFARDHRLLEAVDSLETVDELVAFLADEAKAKPAHEIWALVGDACAKCGDTGELFDAKHARLRVLGAEAAVAKLEAALAIARAKLDKTTSASLRARRQRAVDELDQQLERRRHQ